MPKANMIFNTGALIDKGIARLRGNIANTNALSGALAVAIVAHAQQHGDVTRAESLFNALTNNMRRTMLVNYFAYFNIQLKKEGGKVKATQMKDGVHKAFNPLPASELLDVAKANPWYEDNDLFGNTPEIMPYTFGAMNEEVISFTDRLRKRITSGGSRQKPVTMTDEEKRVALAELDKLDDVIRTLAPKVVGTDDRVPAVEGELSDDITKVKQAA